MNINNYSELMVEKIANDCDDYQTTKKCRVCCLVITECKCSLADFVAALNRENWNE
jgi:hypothetical protein